MGAGARGSLPLKGLQAGVKETSSIPMSPEKLSPRTPSNIT